MLLNTFGGVFEAPTKQKLIMLGNVRFSTGSARECVTVGVGLAVRSDRGLLWGVREAGVPDPQMVRSARDHLATRYATGVEALMWEEHHHPLPDLDAVKAVIAAQRHGHVPGESLDLGAALVLIQAARGDLDRLEAELLETAREAGLTWQQIAAVLDLPAADEAELRYQALRKRFKEPVDEVPPLRPPTG